jgi:hypothetical protein
MAEHVENPFLSYLKSMKDTLAQQRKTRSTIAHPFDELQLVYFPLNHSVALNKGESSDNCRFVPFYSSNKALRIRGSGFHAPEKARYQVALQCENVASCGIAGPVHMLDPIPHEGTEAAPTFPGRQLPVLKIHARNRKAACHARTGGRGN